MEYSLTDDSIMPFGLHKDKKMANVPATYLLYIFEKGWIKDPGVKQYVVDNLDGLRQEAKQTKKNR